MKKAKKFSSFEDLKSSERKTVDNKLSVKRHNDFERVVKHIYSIKVHKMDNSQS